MSYISINPVSLYFVRSGNLVSPENNSHGGGGQLKAGQDGNYWSSMPIESSYPLVVWFLTFDISNVNPSSGSMRYFAYSLRCLAS